MFLSSSDATKVFSSVNGKMRSPSPFDEAGVNLSLSFRTFKESLGMLEAFPRSSFSLAVIRELPIVARDDTKSSLAPLANKATSPLGDDDEFPLTVKEELLLATDEKSTLADEEISPLAVDEESSLTDNEDTPLVDNG